MFENELTILLGNIYVVFTIALLAVAVFFYIVCSAGAKVLVALRGHEVILLTKRGFKRINTTLAEVEDDKQKNDPKKPA